MNKNKGKIDAAKKNLRPEEQLLTESSPFHIREAFKTIRTNLLFTLATTNSKTFVMASAMPNEGKSTTSVNLAIVLAQTGSQVLLMDAIAQAFCPTGF